MDKLFLQIINMSITSSYVIMFVIVIRLLLKRFPKVFSYALWSVVLFRLVSPFTIEGIFSLIPVKTSVPMDIAYTAKPQINSGITAIDNTVNNILPPATPMASANPLQIWIAIGEVIWLIGISLLLVYSIFTTIKLYKNLQNSTFIRDNIYETDKFKTPFVFGIVRPKIYLPANLSEMEKTYITLHEQTHIKRLDHVVKLFSFIITCIHWFNPFVWIAFLLMGEDMELSCDESVIKKMGSDIKREYSSSLLSLSTGKKIIGGCPIAFGENNIKGRIKNVLNYKKPCLWLIIIVTVVVLIIIVGLLTNSSEKGAIMVNNIIYYQNGEILNELPPEAYEVGELEGILHNKNKSLERNFQGYMIDEKYAGNHLYKNKVQDNILYLEDLSGYFIVFFSKETTNYDKTSVTVEDYAWDFIDDVIKNFSNTEQDGNKIIDKKITKLEMLSSFNNILAKPVEIWRLEYRLKPENIDKVLMAGGMQKDGEWITEDNSMGKPNLVFTYEDDKLIYLGELYSSRFDINSLSTQEISLRMMLENKGLLPNDTYGGKHVVIKFPLSTGEISQLLLSQPVKQGNTGIWAVERWMDGNGIIYHEVPNLVGDMKINDYYKDLQEQVDNGHKPWLLNPVEVGYDYIINTLGQILVKMDDLEVINPATMNDFLNTPESHFIGYITMMTMDESLFHLDKVEFLTLEDKKRAAELNIDINLDMPSGFYIYNNDNYPMAFEVYDKTEYLILNSAQLSEHLSVSKKEFIEYIDATNNNSLFHIYKKDGYVRKIEEQYLP